MTYGEFHECHGHCGDKENCQIRQMLKGNMRRIRKPADVIRDRRYGFAWTADMITWSHRSVDGQYKWLIVLRDGSQARLVKVTQFPLLVAQ